MDAPHADAPHADAPVDAAVDGSPDARIDAAPPGLGQYVVSRTQIPTTSSEVNMLGLDIDGDQPTGDLGVDNQFGAVLAAFAQQGFPVQAAIDHAVDFGTAITLLHLDPATAALGSFVGANPNPPACTGPTDTVCRHHLDGDAGFDLATGVPTGTMPTTTVATTTTGGPGTAVVRIAPFGEPAITLELIGARFVGTIDGTGVSSARLAGAIRVPEIDTVLIPALGNNLRATIMMDCPTPAPPDCMCMPGSTGENLVNIFDADADCSVSDDELRADPLINGFFMPDVTIDGVDALSFGFGVTAVTGSFTPP